MWDRTWDHAWDPAASVEDSRVAGLPSATEPGLCNLVDKLFLQGASHRAGVSHLHSTTQPQQERPASSFLAAFEKKTNPSCWWDEVRV